MICTVVEQGVCIAFNLTVDIQDFRVKEKQNGAENGKRNYQRPQFAHSDSQNLGRLCSHCKAFWFLFKLVAIVKLIRLLIGQ